MHSIESWSHDPLTSFSFETVRLNNQGKIIERKTLESQQWLEDLGGGVSLEMVLISAGQFLMGSPEDEAERTKAEGPQHPVKVPAFFLSKYPVTQAQWKRVALLSKVDLDLNPDPAHFKGEQRPIEQVSWLEAVEFCHRLSRVTNRPYRLPSEAEWEYACRAGTTTSFSCGPTLSPEVVNYDGNSSYEASPTRQYRQETSDVGMFPGNAFGLFDMHGNVWEWCQDTWHNRYDNAPNDGSGWTDGESAQSLRLLRGGSWLNYPASCRSAYRLKNTPTFRSNCIGFRVAFMLP